MDFNLTEEQRAIRDLFRTFAQEQVKPLAQELDEHPRYPAELVKQAGALGLFAMRYPEPDGAGAEVVSYVLAMEEIAAASLAVAASCAMQSLMGTTFVQRFAEGDVRERLLGPALRGDVIGTICMTEPDAGSDLFSMTTRAERRAGAWRITGKKTWITSATEAGMFTVFARTSDKQLSVFLVEQGARGLTVGRAIDKMGVKASPTSEVFFDDVEATCMLGEEGRGTDYLRGVLAEIRVMTAALGIGVARAALEDTLAYASERKQFGKPIIKFQAVAAHLAEMAVQLEAARQLTLWAAWRSDQGLENAHEASMAKLFATEAALAICDHGARVHASYGFASEYPIQRYLRDVRFTLIGGGTSEILRVNIARGLCP